MSVATIIESPHPTLRTQSVNIDQFDQDVVTLAEELTQTLSAHQSLGLSAPQIGKPLKMVALQLNDTEPVVFINPQICKRVGKALVQESCLSLPGLKGTVKRATKVEVSAQSVSGEQFETTLTNMHAVCMQHEIDHLNGILFIDRLVWLSRTLLSLSPATRGWSERHA